LRRSRAGATIGGMRPDPWARAQALANEERYAEAVHALYAAVIEELAATQSVRMHASKTSGDYVRELRRAGSPAVTTFRTFARRVDRVIYGLRQCTAEDFALLLRDAEPILATRRAA
jgi:hypothetical protein